MRTTLCALVLVVAAATLVRGQADTSPPATPLPPDQAATLTYNNRAITVFRAKLLSRGPAERVAGATRVLDELVSQGVTGPVAARLVGDIVFITVNDRVVMTLTAPDVDDLSGETLDGRAQSTVAALRQALSEAAELRRPRQLLWSSLFALAGTLGFVAVLVLLGRLRRAAVIRAVDLTEKHLKRFPNAQSEVLPHDRLSAILHRLVYGVVVASELFIGYLWLTFVLRRFPYTRPWGESLRTFLLSRISTLAGNMIQALPGLFTVLVIFLIARFMVRISNHIFDAIAAGRISAPAVWVETAQSTKRLVAALLWAFALVQAYPFIPGSGSNAFAGVSVFVGLMISLGATGVVNQVITSFILTYTRALRVSEYVKIGGVEGTVTQIGVLSAKIRTPLGEEVTIPNTVILSDTTTNFSRFVDQGGVYVTTTITIGYDVPWRQVHAFLVMAAERTAGIRRRPEPVVRQSALEDFYVRYTLLFSLERADQRGPVLTELHANIQDLFNEFGVQIMSPNYVADPGAPKVVPNEHWHDAPADVPAGHHS